MLEQVNTLLADILKNLPSEIVFSLTISLKYNRLIVARGRGIGSVSHF